jgi:putative nucleotidyltransferase with HDIG domain
LRGRAEQEQFFQRLQASMESSILALTSTIEMRDPYTAGHQRRVAELAKAVAHELAWDEERVRALYLAGLVHDIGKIAIPAEILSKPGRLSMVELSLVRTHVDAGYNILKNIEFPWPIADIVHQHHERFDGSGYPLGLKGTSILPEARILAVCDVVEAMSMHRPYRPGLGLDAALAEVESGRGTAYDPACVDACCRLLREERFRFD